MRSLDHVVLNTRERTDDAVALFTRLGFQVGARGVHTLGSINHTIVFAADYLELLGYPPGAPPPRRPELVQRPLGLMATVLGTADADATRDELLAARLKPRPVQEFSRPVDLPDGCGGAAVFRVTRLEPDAVPGTWFYFCQQQTPHMVWHPAWQVHANGVQRIAAIDIEVPDLAAALPLYAACTAVAFALSGNDAVFRLGDCDINVRQSVGTARMTGITFGCHALAPLAALFESACVRFESTGSCITVDPAETLGAKLQFIGQAL